MLKKCGFCGKEFPIHNPRKKYCSDNCARQAANEKQKIKVRKAQYTVEKRCKNELCGKLFEGRISKVFCSRACGETFRYEDKLAKARIVSRERREGIEGGGGGSIPLEFLERGDAHYAGYGFLH